jgi:methanogenic corrinoid protein MtbC1
MKNTRSLVADVKYHLIGGETIKLQELIESALKKGVEAEAILDQGLIAGMGELGHRFEKKERRF